MFWTLHETGHAAFDIFQVPLFGREEDAADLFAAYIMLHCCRKSAPRTASTSSKPSTMRG